MSARRLFIWCALLIGFSGTAFGHEAGPADYNELRYWWVFDPGVVIPLMVSALLYGIGAVRLVSGVGARSVPV